MSRSLCVPESTLRGWLKEELNLQDFITTVDTKKGLTRKRARLANDPELDNKVFEWFVQQREAGTPIAGPVIQAQAKKFHQALHGESDFTCSTGWLRRWKDRHGIRQVKIFGETRSADAQAATEFIPTFREFIAQEGYTKDQIYNADETGFAPKILPDKTLATRNDIRSREGFKTIKERQTILFCTNWSGSHKLKPLFIGKFRAPRCFHHVNLNSLPVDYTFSNKAWMTASIFQDWFFKKFVPDVRRHLRSMGQEERALLLLDNCPAHPPSSTLQTADKKFVVYYLPKNTTSKIQPMDQGIIQNFKLHYRTELMTSISSDSRDVTDFLKTFNMKESIYMVGEAWNKVSKLSINNCWEHAMKMNDDSSVIDREDDDSGEDEEADFLGFTQEEVNLATKKLIKEMGEKQDFCKFLQEWASIDDHLPTAKEFTEDELLAPEEEEEDDEEFEISPSTPTSTPTNISDKQAVEFLQQLQTWGEARGLDSMKILQIRSLLFTAKKMEASSKKQMKITDIFKSTA